MRKGLVGWLVGWGLWVEADAADSIIRRDCNRAGCTARKNGQARYPLGEKVRVIDGIQWFSWSNSLSLAYTLFLAEKVFLASRCPVVCQAKFRIVHESEKGWKRVESEKCKWWMRRRRKETKDKEQSERRRTRGRREKKKEKNRKRKRKRSEVSFGTFCPSSFAPVAPVLWRYSS
ncbi:hypothetical protein V1478_000597 [Vespula squamosa]|uniref:Secreted protein n=1 Tax=Vespula squamosa TaxID=30214 RepID=A0ABD2C5X5_VESSQ